VWFIINRHFGQTCRLHLQRRRSKSQTVANRLTTVREALILGEWSASRPGDFNPGKEPPVPI
jgi:hypothetical protein